MTARITPTVAQAKVRSGSRRIWRRRSTSKGAPRPPDGSVRCYIAVAEGAQAMTLRDDNLDRLGEQPFDVLVLGGGINGAVSAAALAGRGARVALIDRGDFAGFTSQHSSNLAWGGIKYMEGLELGLVRKLCKSRNHLIQSYPSTVQEIRFYAAHERTFRHGLWKLVLGTWLYWLIGSFFTQRPRRLTLADIAREEPIVDTSRCD